LAGWEVVLRELRRRALLLGRGYASRRSIEEAHGRGGREDTADHGGAELERDHRPRQREGAAGEDRVRDRPADHQAPGECATSSTDEGASTTRRDPRARSQPRGEQKAVENPGGRAGENARGKRAEERDGRAHRCERQNDRVAVVERVVRLEVEPAGQRRERRNER